MKSNFRKILAMTGTISFLAPTSLSVVACGKSEKSVNNVYSIITAINNVANLKLNISEKDESNTVFNVLSDNENGLTLAIAKHYIANFDKKLFNLDTKNVYTDLEKNHKVSEEQKIQLTTYYFQFTYANKENDAIVPITITNREKEVVTAINNINYDISAIVETKAEIFQEMINFKFIKNSLNDNIKNIFNDSLFHLNNITIAGKEITDQDLNGNDGLISAKINYNYDTIENQITNLKISKNWPEITKGEFVKIAQERSQTDPMVFTIKVKKPGNYEYLPIVLQNMRIAIYQEFSDTYKLRIDLNKLKMTDIQSDEMNPIHFDDNWFIDTKRFNAIGSAEYDGQSTGPIKIIFDVVQK